MFSRGLKEIEEQVTALIDPTRLAEEIRNLVLANDLEGAIALANEKRQMQNAPAIIAEIRALWEQLTAMGITEPSLDSPQPPTRPVTKAPRTKTQKRTEEIRSQKPELLRAQEFATRTKLRTNQLAGLVSILLTLETAPWLEKNVASWKDVKERDLTNFHVITGPYKSGSTERRFTTLALQSFESRIRLALPRKGKGGVGRIDKNTVPRRLKNLAE